MAYQKVGGTPRFYIDQIQYLKSLNFDFEKFYADNNAPTNNDNMSIYDDYSPFSLSPETQTSFTHPSWETDNSTSVNYFYWTLPFPDLLDFIETSDDCGIFVAFLNHNLGDEQSRFLVEYGDFTGLGTKWINKDSILNFGSKGTHNHDALNGSTVIEIPEGNSSRKFIRIGMGHIAQNGMAGHINLGALSYGVFYDMPVSPDLDLSMEIEFDGVNNIKTLSGHTITQANYQGSPWWYDKDGNKVEPWSVGQSTGITKRNGRRVWKLKFSYMSDKDLFASNYGSSTYAEEGNLTEIGYDGGDVDDKNWTEVPLVNGNFENDLTGWAHSGATIETVDGSKVCRIQSVDPEYKYIKQSGIIVSGLEYKLIYDIIAVNSGSLTVENLPNADLTTTVGVNHELTYTATSNNFILKRGANPSDVSVDNLRLFVSKPKDFYYNIDNDDSFSAQVLNKVSHGEKFIFQPDNTANNPSDFAICVLDGDSFSMKRTAWNVYDIEMTIREVW